MFHKYAGKLTDEQKVYVVTRLASYGTPSAIARDLKANFGIEVTPQAIDQYHPERASGGGLGQRWKDLFRAARKAYLAAAAEIGTNEPLVRMRWREDMVLEAWDAGDYRMANAMLDSIAKEAGGVFRSKHEHGRVGSGNIPLAATITYLEGPAPVATDGTEKPPADQPEGVGAAPLRRVRAG